MRNASSSLERLLSTANARRAARRERRAIETYLADETVSPNARKDLEVILFRQGAVR